MSTPYEQERLKNIELNKQLIEQLGISSLSTASSQVSTNVPSIIKRKKYTAKPKKEPAVLTRRKSSRLRGEKPLAIEIDKENNIELLGDDVKDDPRLLELIDEGRLLTAQEYFSKEIRDTAIVVDGHFQGWVNPETIKRHGIETSASEAWEKNGGGTYSYLDPTGSGNKRKKGSISNAKNDALKMFKKNPNQYFYRHNEPGEEQWVHDWSIQEKDLFLRVAREHGCGDKWGLFASYIPHRFGYQCSSFYRHEIIKNGLVFDPNFQFTPSGEPVYAGSHRSRR
ncbi:hypothetical protein EDC94DRAFT_618919 [Helicostylum pulchrum]|nr:hypothetical protein EDC94DRAFT_618919 [Helicostylum pulchrum]